jgi:hypothetical protein
VEKMACEWVFSWMAELTLDEVVEAAVSVEVEIVGEEKVVVALEFSHVFHHTYHLSVEQVKLALHELVIDVWRATASDGGFPLSLVALLTPSDLLHLLALLFLAVLVVEAICCVVVAED